MNPIFILFFFWQQIPLWIETLTLKIPLGITEQFFCLFSSYQWRGSPKGRLRRTFLLKYGFKRNPGCFLAVLIYHWLSEGFSCIQVFLTTFSKAIPSWKYSAALIPRYTNVLDFREPARASLVKPQRHQCSAHLDYTGHLVPLWISCFVELFLGQNNDILQQERGSKMVNISPSVCLKCYKSK